MNDQEKQEAIKQAETHISFLEKSLERAIKELEILKAQQMVVVHDLRSVDPMKLRTVTPTNGDNYIFHVPMFGDIEVKFVEHEELCDGCIFDNAGQEPDVHNVDSRAIGITDPRVEYCKCAPICTEGVFKFIRKVEPVPEPEPVPAPEVANDLQILEEDEYDIDTVLEHGQMFKWDSLDDGIVRILQVDADGGGECSKCALNDIGVSCIGTPSCTTRSFKFVDTSKIGAPVVPDAPLDIGHNYNRETRLVPGTVFSLENKRYRAVEFDDNSHSPCSACCFCGEDCSDTPECNKAGVVFEEVPQK